MTLLSARKFKAPLVDPFCGSGTLLIEAALLAKNIAPGLQRKFAFQGFRNFDDTLWNTLVHAAQAKQFSHPYRLIGYDRDTAVLDYAQQNAERAGVADCISFSALSFPHSVSSHALSSRLPSKDEMWLLTNPPYGKRLSADEDLQTLYQQLAASFEQCSGGVISSYPEMASLFPPARFSHKSLYNGAEKVDFYRKKPL
jgi:putative N6-adenine-specific DNA methylase